MRDEDNSTPENDSPVENIENAKPVKNTNNNSGKVKNKKKNRK